MRVPSCPNALDPNANTSPARVTTARAPVRRGDVHRERVAKRARYQARGVWFPRVSSRRLSRTGRRRFRVAVRVARVATLAPRARAASPGEHGAAPRDRERVVLPRGDADDAVVWNSATGKGTGPSAPTRRRLAASCGFRVSPRASRRLGRAPIDTPFGVVRSATARDGTWRRRTKQRRRRRRRVVVRRGEAPPRRRGFRLASRRRTARAPRVQEPLRALGIALGRPELEPVWRGSARALAASAQARGEHVERRPPARSAGWSSDPPRSRSACTTRHLPWYIARCVAVQPLSASARRDARGTRGKPRRPRRGARATSRRRGTPRRAAASPRATGSRYRQARSRDASRARADILGCPRVSARRRCRLRGARGGHRAGRRLRPRDARLMSDALRDTDHRHAAFSGFGPAVGKNSSGCLLPATSKPSATACTATDCAY